MLREYSRTKAESLAQMRATISELQHFSKGLFFIGAPCIYGTEEQNDVHGDVYRTHPSSYLFFFKSDLPTF